MMAAFENPEQVFAVRWTNVNLNGGQQSEINPDKIAASVDVLFYAGENVKVKCKFKYTEIDRLLNTTSEISYEEQRLNHYCCQIVRAKEQEFNHRPKKATNILLAKRPQITIATSEERDLPKRQDLFKNVCEPEILNPCLENDQEEKSTLIVTNDCVSDEVNSSFSKENDQEDKSTLIVANDCVFSDEVNSSFSNENEQEEETTAGQKSTLTQPNGTTISETEQQYAKKIQPASEFQLFASSFLKQIPTKEEHCFSPFQANGPSTFKINKPIWGEKITFGKSDSQLRFQPSGETKKKVMKTDNTKFLKWKNEHENIERNRKVLRRKLHSMDTSNDSKSDDEMLNSFWKAKLENDCLSEEIQEVGLAQNSCQMQILGRMDDGFSILDNRFGLYEEDVENIFVSHSNKRTGLGYCRNPFSCVDLSPAYPSDTVIGFFEQSIDVADRVRIVPHGKGKLLTESGDVIYIGDFKHGKRSGFGSGIIVDTSADIHHGVGYYQGHWKSNCRHGSGIINFVSRFQYEGGWYMDKPHGHGILSFPDGSVMRGHFAGGMQEGCFTYYTSEGNIELRDYQNGQLLSIKSLGSSFKASHDLLEKPISMKEYYEENVLKKLKKDGNFKVTSTLAFNEPDEKVSVGHDCNITKKDIQGTFSSDAADCSEELAENRSTVEVEMPHLQYSEADLKTANCSSNADMHAATKMVPENVQLKTTYSALKTKNSLELKQARKVSEDTDGEEDRSVGGEIDLDYLLQHVMRTFQHENRFLLNHQLTSVQNCCEEMLLNAKDELSKITCAHEKHVTEIKDNESEVLTASNSNVLDLSKKFDSILELNRSILDKLEDTEKRISALDVNIADITAHGNVKEIEELKTKLKQKETQLAMAENIYKCQICQETRQNCVLMPCMHMQTCSKCVQRIRDSQAAGRSLKCPICRTNVQGEIHVKML